MQGVYSTEDLKESIANALDLVIHNSHQFEIIKKENYFKNLWFKINTGMNRLGFEEDEFMNIYNANLRDKKFVLMSHLSASNVPDEPSNKIQFDRFDSLSNKLHSGVYKSVANTGCIINFPEKSYDWVRVGIGIFGGYIGNNDLKTAMTLRSPIINVRNIKRGIQDRNMDKKLYRLEMEKIRMKKQKMKEEFIQEVEDKKDSKAKKVIDIMKGKNSVKINPDMKEDTVVVQDASGKDSVEIVDIISPQKVRSDWRKEINVTEASAAWQRKEGKSKSGGLNEKGRKSYERQNPGSDLKAPSKKVGNKRRASFCARMKGMKKKLTSAKTARDPNSRINKSLRAWNC